MDYQQAYQRYEEEQIAAGRSLDDPHFYDSFHDKHGSIASRVGPEDQFVTYPRPSAPISTPAILLLAGLGTLVAAGILWLISWIHRRRSVGAAPLV